MTSTQRPVRYAADRLDLHPHRLAAEHVLDAHLAQLAREVAAALQQLEDGRDRAHRHAALAAGLDDAPAQLAGGRRDRDQHLVGLDVLEHLRRDRTSCPSTSARCPAWLVVVDEADRAVPEVRVLDQLVEQQVAAVAGADDQHRARVAARRAAR